MAEVAAVGGFEPQYQVMVDPVRLRARGVSMAQVVEAVKKSNSEAGGRLLELRRRRIHDSGPRIPPHPQPTWRNVIVGRRRREAVVRVRDVGRRDPRTRTCAAAPRTGTERASTSPESS